ncbi:DUF5908 family protein [Candidatus Colwellia aromaticivorans]|uniref:DUF5908 family protein n=1 Tax=Candidatus Colwellia aromaticivorans TaxID=2267621 RepID=UPI0014438DC0|nr:DUF5908 family protein [Candidatus Colwellia aromaticivorans]
MPLIIDEVVISVEVNGAGNKPTQNLNKEMTQDLIEECVEKVLEILKEKEER